MTLNDPEWRDSYFVLYHQKRFVNYSTHAISAVAELLVQYCKCMTMNAIQKLARVTAKYTLCGTLLM